MAWTFKNGDAYTGDTHELAGMTYSGKTRTRDSKPLLEVKEAAVPKKPRKTRATPFKKEK